LRTTGACSCTVHSSFTLNILARIGTSGRAISSMTARAQELQVNLEVVAVPPTALRADGSQVRVLLRAGPCPACTRGSTHRAKGTGAPRLRGRRLGGGAGCGAATETRRTPQRERTGERRRCCLLRHAVHKVPQQWPVLTAHAPLQGLRYKLTLLKPGMGFDVLSLVADAAARSGLSIEELKRITPMTLAAEGSDGSPSVGLQMILEEGGTASGAVTGGYMMTLSVAQLRMPSSD
jgi:hypothetical protein